MKIPIILTPAKGKTPEELAKEAKVAVKNFFKKKKELEEKPKEVECEITFVPEYHKKEEK